MLADKTYSLTLRCSAEGDASKGRGFELAAHASRLTTFAPQHEEIL